MGTVELNDSELQLLRSIKEGKTESDEQFLELVFLKTLNLIEFETKGVNNDISVINIKLTKEGEYKLNPKLLEEDIKNTFG